MIRKMGMDEILEDIITGGEVSETVLSNKHKIHGTLSRQLRKLRDKGLTDRRLVIGKDTLGRFRRQWIYFPTAEALELYKKEVVE